MVAVSDTHEIPTPFAPLELAIFECLSSEQLSHPELEYQEYQELATGFRGIQVASSYDKFQKQL
ncbi:hypothetical protein H5410_011836 [Solanum commersonii]|uniref:Uncharacterized protein n=1 Tax=Solanum commersonii TaxID=4109 RepID=A0A9J6AR03_SOLCO|nr:hypothetical protein H5410_011836 [Solanum commersonii]